MKKKTKVIILIAVTIILICSSFTVGRGISRFFVQFDEIQYFVDPATGVNYLILIDRFDRGAAGGICVRVNPDGTPMVTK